MKICKNCWYYMPSLSTSDILDDPKSSKKLPFCEFDNDVSSVNPDDTCENWESKKLELIKVIKTIYSL